MIRSWLIENRSTEVSYILEPISKLFEQHGDACELHKTQEVGGVIFPANQPAPLPLEPRKEPFDEPAALVPAQAAAVLGFEFPSGPVRRDQVHPVLLEVIIEPVAVIGAIANEVLGLGLQHIEVETELDQCDLMMIGRVRTDGEWQPMAIHNREDLHAFATAGFPDVVAAALGRGTCRIDEALALVDPPFVAQRIRELRENLPQHLACAPLLKAAMHRLVVGITLGEQVPLRPRVQNPQHRFQDRTCGDRLAPRAPVGDVSLGKMFPNPFPLVVAQPQHARTYT